MARRHIGQEKWRDRFPDTVVISVGGPKNAPYFTLHKDGVANIGTDMVVGVYQFKRVAKVQVTRKLKKLKE